MAQVDLNVTPGCAGMLFSRIAVGVKVQDFLGCGKFVDRARDDHEDLGRWTHFDVGRCRGLVSG